jgi:hypothetical protein
MIARPGTARQGRGLVAAAPLRGVPGGDLAPLARLVVPGRDAGDGVQPVVGVDDRDDRDEGDELVVVEVLAGVQDSFDAPP